MPSDNPVFERALDIMVPEMHEGVLPAEQGESLPNKRREDQTFLAILEEQEESEYATMEDTIDEEVQATMEDMVDENVQATEAIHNVAQPPVAENSGIDQP